MILAVLGHVDHGKTALVRALTGMETDRLPEERRRGLSIVLGFAHADLGVPVDFIDAPGHERFVRTLVPALAGARAALLVLAAPEGVKPQTREHVLIAARLGVRRAVLAITKSDIASEDDIRAARRAGEALLKEAGLRLHAALPVSAVSGAGIEALKAALAELAAFELPAEDRGAPFLPFDRAFLVSGRGVVATGTLRGGAIQTGQELEIMPGGARARVRGLQIHGREVSEAPPGSRVAVNLAGATVQDLKGRSAALPGALAASGRLHGLLVPGPGTDPPRSGAEVELLIGAARAQARSRDLGALDGGGGARLVELRLAAPLAVPNFEPFIIRSSSPPATLGGGFVLDPAPPRAAGRREADLLRRLAAAGARGAEASWTALLLEARGPRGLPLPELARKLNASPAFAAQVAAAVSAVALSGPLLIDGIAFARLLSRLDAFLAARPEGLALGEIARAVGPASEVALAAALRTLKDQGRAVISGGRVRLFSAAGESARRSRAESLARQIAEEVRGFGLSPPDPIPKDAPRESRLVLEGLLRAGVLVRARDRVQGRDVIFHRDAVEEARRRLAPHLGPPGLRVGEAGRLLGVTRKYAVPLLEHLDAIRFTVRDGDRRVLGPGLAL